VYNALSPKVAPDVVFGPDDEGFQPLVDYAEAGNDASCLARWDYRDPRGLVALVHELRELYIEYHKKQVAKVDDARVTFELSTVLSKEGIEVCMVPSADRPDEVKFAVPLLDVDFDFNKLVPGCPWRLPQKIHLQVIFPISRSSSYSSVPSAPRLKLTSTSDLKSLFSVEDVKLPPWSNGMCLAEYLPALEESLNLLVVEASASIGARRRFIEALAPTFGRPIEADPIFCRRATVLSISGVFTFLVHFAIPLQFPKQQPVLTLQSSQHCNADGIPITSPPINDYPWSPRWDQAEMVERIYDFLTDECQNFKKFCSDTVTQQK
jgi:BRCA1-A complex subunit BRE